ncbi:MAG: tetratricopeptide repeat protein [Rhodospirillales bacterium]|nr:tetratricopeptide repeat protein [Rhodospirillales bacterium]
MARIMRIAAIRELIGNGALKEASEACRRRIDRNDDPEARYLLAVVTGQMGLYSESVALFKKAISEFPERSDVAYNYGIVLQNMGKLDDAIAQWSRAVAMNPWHADAQFNLGRAYSDKKMWSEALAPCESAASLRPENKLALLNLGSVNFRLGRMPQAKYCFGLAAKIDPAFVQGWINLGLSDIRAGDPGAAIAALERAVALDPASVLAHFNLGQALLHAGRLREGLAEVEWRRRVHTLPFAASGRPPWQGGDIAGKTVLVYGEQGQGDVVHFLRYAESAAARGARVVVCCHAGLVGIARRARGVADAVAFGETPPTFDTYAPLMSLPHLLGLDAFADAPAGPYVIPPEPAELAGGEDAVRVGLVWAGNPEHDDDANRSMSLTDWRPLLDVAGVAFYSLQVGAAVAEVASQGLAAKVTDLGSGFKDFVDTAAAIQALDLVIAVDTAVPHLAGALGKPVWVLLARVADWRWGRDGAATPWYPTMRLFRQQHARDWPPVVEEVAGALAELVAGGR